MPFLVPFVPLLTAGVNAGASAYGAHAAGKANDKAVAAQSAANREALDFEKQKYADLNSRLAPYRDAGAASTRRMSDLLGISPGAASTPGVKPMSGYFAPAMSNTVRLVAPDGTQREVEARLADAYIARGAKRVM